jgi:hypothetical protein
MPMNAPGMMPPPGMMPMPPPQKSSKPIIAGVMYILAFLIGLWETMAMMTAYSALQAAGGLAGGADMGMFGMLSGYILMFLVIFLLGMIGSLLAAIMCFMRKKFMIGVIGGVLSLVGLHLLFGLIGFVLMLGSKDQFAK